MNILVDLISDTVTRPTPQMKVFMLDAELGDDVFREDPTVNKLEAKLAEMFGKDAGLFCPSGTMTNQIALQLHLQDMQEVICERGTHVYQYETGGFARHARSSIRLIDGNHGRISPDQITSAVRPHFDWLPRSRLVVIENSCASGGGSYYTLRKARQIQQTCADLDLKLHLDGARIFNVLVETGDPPSAWGDCCDTLSICLSKGLGAPIGSVLLGDHSDIIAARRYRKVMGGGMRQVGMLAAAGIFALDHHVDRLVQDHQHAGMLAAALQKLSIIEEVAPAPTNIVVARTKITATALAGELNKQGIRIGVVDEHTVRIVTHLDLTEEKVAYTIEAINQLENAF